MFWVSRESLRMFDFFGTFSENNGTFWETWNILRKSGTFWENPGIFFEKNIFFSHPSFYFSIRPFLCHLDLLRKMKHFEKYRVLFWETYISNRNFGRACVKNPTDPFFAGLSKCENFWEIYVSNLDGVLLTHAQVSLASKTSTKWSSPKCQWWCHKWDTENVEKGNLQEALWLWCLSFVEYHGICSW